jgi:FkbM family methyltransferase
MTARRPGVFDVQFSSVQFEKRIRSAIEAPAFRMAAGAPAPEQRDLNSLLALPNDREFLEGAYELILGRRADLAGLTGYLEALQNHVPRQTILRRLADSPEAARRRAAGGDHQEKKPSLQQRVREGLSSFIHQRVLGGARELVRRVLLTRFDSIDYRLVFLLEELSSQNEALSRRVEELGANLETSTSRFEEALRSRQGGFGESPGIGFVRISDDILLTEAAGFVLAAPQEEWPRAARYRQTCLSEPGVASLFKQMITPGMTVVDAGAGGGIYTLHAAKALGGNGLIHSFDPAPGKLELLRRNLALNGLSESNVTLHASALADRCGRADFRLLGSGSGTLRPETGDGSTVSVDVTTLDAVFEGARIDILRVSAEAAESGILKGLRTVVRQNPGIKIFMKCCPQNLRNAHVTPSPLLEEIAAAGLDFKAIDTSSGALSSTSSEELAATSASYLLLSVGGVR